MGCSTEKLGSFDRAYKESMTNARVNSLSPIEKMECRIVRDLVISFVLVSRDEYPGEWKNYLRIFKKCFSRQLSEFNVTIDRTVFRIRSEEKSCEDSRPDLNLSVPVESSIPFYPNDSSYDRQKERVASGIMSAHDSRMCFKFQCLPPNVLVIP